ncbi:Protein of uncharacterised function (DUF3540) [Legionella steigerwaltii]|uniref:Protein of uncharacterized function (DUF3540) n=1 Tax=Legionella steigerwaltii TaxID=460 RepID=A0A378LC87_9GAMM|nr:DUF3540 domain-containing protein [Legionella steigerwaltii]KTD72045.1 hypothetical protein Lstg_2746 [Legionella steigerwaltii]STY21711.1 Protein of uncharacterised function (DUF3540) [Legionella steigerwaltii]
MLEPELTRTGTQGELLRGKIKFCSGDGYHILIQGHLVNAQPAFSCLITPLVDDDVLLFKEANNYYILSIIHRPKPAPVTMKLGENLSLIGENHDLKLNAPHIHLVAQETINLSSPVQNIECNQGTFSINNVLFKGDVLNFSYQSLNMMCNYMQTISDTINTQAIRFYQQINELEHQLIGHLRSIVKHTYRIDCDEMEIYAQGDAKIAAKQVQLG